MAEKKIRIRVMPGSIERTLGIEETLTLQQLAEKINREWKDVLVLDLVDRQGYLNVEFIVNGSYTRPDYRINDGDVITIIPFIAGG